VSFNNNLSVERNLIIQGVCSGIEYLMNAIRLFVDEICNDNDLFKSMFKQRRMFKIQRLNKTHKRVVL